MRVGDGRPDAARPDDGDLARPRGSRHLATARRSATACFGADATDMGTVGFGPGTIISISAPATAAALTAVLWRQRRRCRMPEVRAQAGVLTFVSGVAAGLLV